MDIGIRVTDKEWMQWAKIHTFDGSPLGFGGTTLAQADVVYLTATEFNEWVDKDVPFPLPFVVSTPERMQTAWTKAADKAYIDRLIGILKVVGAQADPKKRGVVDAQAFSGHYKQVMETALEDGSDDDSSDDAAVLRMDIDVAISRIEQEWIPDMPCLPTDAHPLNLLNLSGLHGIQLRCMRPEPGTSSHATERFRTIDKVAQILRNDFNAKIGQGTSTGKSSRATIDSGREIDLEACLQFLIAAGFYSISGCHLDSFCGTTVFTICGVKLWFLVEAGTLSNEELNDFERNGFTWMPPKGLLKLILLRPGEELHMPPNLRCIHCPISLAPTIMTGGAFWGEFFLPEMLDNLLYILQHPEVTNEAAARQLQQFLGKLKQYVKNRSDERQDAKDVEVRIDRIVGELKKMHFSTKAKATARPKAKAKAKGTENGLDRDARKPANRTRAARNV